MGSTRWPLCRLLAEFNKRRDSLWRFNHYTTTGARLLLSPAERSQRTYLRKVREAILASEIERRYSKDEILELYLNEIYYGNLAYGVEAAAETYFNKSASQFNPWRSSFPDRPATSALRI